MASPLSVTLPCCWSHISHPCLVATAHIWNFSHGKFCCCRLKWCHTDLGANAYKWPKLIQEDHRFSQLGPVACGLPAEHYDGVMVHRLTDAGWRVEHVQDKCLYDHSPSPQVVVVPSLTVLHLLRMAKQGGPWDRRLRAMAGTPLAEH